MHVTCQNRLPRTRKPAHVGENSVALPVRISMRGLAEIQGEKTGSERAGDRGGCCARGTVVENAVCLGEG